MPTFTCSRANRHGAAGPHGGGRPAVRADAASARQLSVRRPAASTAAADSSARRRHSTARCTGGRLRADKRAAERRHGAVRDGLQVLCTSTHHLQPTNLACRHVRGARHDSFNGYIADASLRLHAGSMSTWCSLATWTLASPPLAARSCSSQAAWMSGQYRNTSGARLRPDAN